MLTLLIAGCFIGGTLLTAAVLFRRRPIWPDEQPTGTQPEGVDA